MSDKGMVHSDAKSVCVPTEGREIAVLAPGERWASPLYPVRYANLRSDKTTGHELGKTTVDGGGPEDACWPNPLEAVKWTRFRDDDNECRHDPDWPAGDARDILFWNSCDGFHVWTRGFGCPPGTHWTDCPSPPTKLELQAPVGTSAASEPKPEPNTPGEA